MQTKKKIRKGNKTQGTHTLLKSKYIVICGGCVSGLGKGITTSSMGYLLK